MRSNSSSAVCRQSKNWSEKNLHAENLQCDNVLPSQRYDKAHCLGQWYIRVEQQLN